MGHPVPNAGNVTDLVTDDPGLGFSVKRCFYKWLSAVSLGARYPAVAITKPYTFYTHTSKRLSLNCTLLVISALLQAT